MWGISLTANQWVRRGFPTEKGGHTARALPLSGLAYGDLEASIAGATTGSHLAAAVNRLWISAGQGDLTDDEVVALDALARSRRAHLTGSPRAGAASSVLQRVGSIFKPRRRQTSPDRQASRERRRKLGGSGALPDILRGHFTEGERATLTVIAGEVGQRGHCALPLDKIAALAGVSRTTCQNAIHEARRRGLLSVTLRPRRGAKNLPNLIEITSAEWLAWIVRGSKRRARTADGIGSNPLTASRKLNPTKSLEEKKMPSVGRIGDRSPRFASMHRKDRSHDAY